MLDSISERADAREPRFSGDDIAMWPDGMVARLAESGLVHEVENAASVACDACADRHVEEVVLVTVPRGSVPRAYIVCPENGRVRVPFERLKQWEIDFGGLATAIAGAIEAAGDVEEVAPGRIWFLGKATLAARSREIFLVRGMTWEDAGDVLGKSARLNAARTTLVIAAGAVPPASVWNGDAPTVVALRTVSAFSETGLSLDREYLESALSEGKRTASVASLTSFPTPAGTAWRDVRLTLTDHDLRIEAKGKRREYTFQTAGFEERRKKNTPDRLWALLKALAMHGGVLPFKAVGEKDRTNLKQYVSDLRQRIAALLPGIEGDSIVYDRSQAAYSTAFRISSQEALQFPTPDGASWGDVSIAMPGDTSVRVTVTASEEFTASNYAEDDDGGSTHEWVGAEREGTVERIYDLRMLKLADDQDKPNRAGQSLLAVISGRGTVVRKADDKGMAELCGVLTGLMNISGAPFRFDKPEGKWVALFDAGSGS